MNQRTESQRQQLQEKRQEAIRIYVGACCIFHECMKLGIHATWEMAEYCNAWRLPLLQNLKARYNLSQVVTKGCAVNLRGLKEGRLMSKGWRIMTSHKRLAETMELPCRCSRNYQHEKCEGRNTTQSALYTPEFAKRVAQVMCRELSHADLVQECRGKSQLPELFGLGETCTCTELHLPSHRQPCGTCMFQGSSHIGFPEAIPQQVSRQNDAQVHRRYLLRPRVAKWRLKPEAPYCTRISSMRPVRPSSKPFGSNRSSRT